MAATLQLSQDSRHNIYMVEINSGPTSGSHTFSKALFVASSGGTTGLCSGSGALTLKAKSTRPAYTHELYW